MTVKNYNLNNMILIKLKFLNLKIKIIMKNKKINKIFNNKMFMNYKNKQFIKIINMTSM